jgi:hypothetical protein
MIFNVSAIYRDKYRGKDIRIQFPKENINQTRKEFLRTTYLYVTIYIPNIITPITLI